MCGIVGALNYSEKEVIEALEKIKHRGKDDKDVIKKGNLILAHNLLAIISKVRQPISYKNSFLISNCEIYNWKKLCKKYDIEAKNDAELLIKLLYKKGIKAIKQFDGVFAFAFHKDNKLYLARDFFGVKPLWYFYDSKSLIFASEKKALPKEAIELHPRCILEINTKTLELKKHRINFFKEFKKEYKSSLESLLEKAVKKRVSTRKKIGILLSGGVDSSLLTAIAKKYKKKIVAYLAVFSKDAKDIPKAELAAKHLGIKIKKIFVNKKEAGKSIPKIAKIIESSDPIKVAVAMPFYFCAKEAKKDKVKIMLSGLGAEDLFLGYSRYLNNKDGLYGLRNIHHRDLYRDDLIFMHFGIELRLPYLDKKLAIKALSIDEKEKIKNGFRKYILRKIAEKYLPEEIAFRKKMAAQYSSKSAKILKKIAKESKKISSSFLKDFAQNNEKTAVLFSGGKDSMLAYEIAKDMNYDIKCIISIISKNKDSYMYHTPNIKLSKYQAKALEKDIIIKRSKGIKEKELSALKKAIKEAKDKYNIELIVSGAIFSQYQRDRIEEICESLFIKTYAPLWHKSQEMEVKELIKKKIKAIIVKIAAYGLDKKYLGKEINEELLEHLKKLNKKIGFNIAGEGGEYESFVIDSKSFKKKIKIISYEIKSKSQYEHYFIIKKIKLLEK